MTSKLIVLKCIECGLRHTAQPTYEYQNACPFCEKKDALVQVSFGLFLGNDN